MIIEYIETETTSEAKRRGLIKDLVFLKTCKQCGSNITIPSSISPVRSSSLIAVRWYSSGNDISCSKKCISIMNNKKVAIKNPESYKQRGIKSSAAQKGKSFNTIYGYDKANERKRNLSAKMSENNSRWSLKHRTEEEIEIQKEKNRNANNNPFSIIGARKSFDERYGKEKSDAIKEKISKESSGENNPMYGRPSPLSSGGGRKGYYRGTHFRSSLEMLFMHKCWTDGITYKSAESLSFVVHYELNGAKRTYRPDFYLPDTDTVIEIKPSHLINNYENSKKIEAAQLKFKRFFVITEQDLPWIGKEEYQELIANGCIKTI